MTLISWPGSDCLGQVCWRTGWKVYKWLLMGDYYDLEANRSGNACWLCESNANARLDQDNCIRAQRGRAEGGKKGSGTARDGVDGTGTSRTPEKRLA